MDCRETLIELKRLKKPVYEVEFSWKDMILTVNSFESLTVSVPPKALDEVSCCPSTNLLVY